MVLDSKLTDMQQTSSIKTKTQWVLVSFALTFSCIFALMILAYSWMIEDNIFNRMVNNEANYIQSTYKATGNIVNPRHPFMNLYSSWKELPEPIQLLKIQNPERIEFPLSDGGTIHTHNLIIGQQNWVLVANVSEYEISKDYLPMLVPWLISGVLLVCSFAFFIAMYLSNSITTPLQKLSNSVKFHDKSKQLKFSETYTANEIGYLAHIIEDNFNRLHRALEREADFTRDVSHELRTPTSVIKMIVSRLKPQQLISATTLSQLTEANNYVERTVEVLLALAREESIHSESLNLLELIEHCLVNHNVFSDPDNSKVQLDVPNQQIVVANKNLVELMFNNIFDNVASHASRKEIEIGLHDNILSITNPVNDTPMESILQQGVKHQESKGIGQGLHLIKRICERYQWRVEIDSSFNSFSLRIDIS